jgi:predicted NUDIX family NTP pyrophosphohydrolase
MKQSAGILLYKTEKDQLKILLAKPGGPFWKNKDTGVWSIPKGELDEGEDLLLAAKREFLEETGIAITGNCLCLTPIKQKSGKLVHAWAVEQDPDVTKFMSNAFEMEWPPKSGKHQSFPEIDKIQWFSPDEAQEKMIPAQFSFIRELQNLLKHKH